MYAGCKEDDEEVAMRLEDVTEEGAEEVDKEEMTVKEEDKDGTLGEEAMKEGEVLTEEESVEEATKKPVRKKFSIFKSRNKKAAHEEGVGEKAATQAGVVEKFLETLNEEEPKPREDSVKHVKEVIEPEKKAPKKIATPVRVKNGAGTKEVRKSNRKSARTEEIFASPDEVPTENGKDSINPAEDEKLQVIITSFSSQWSWYY